METLVMAAPKEKPYADLGAMVARYRKGYPPDGLTQDELARRVGFKGTSMMSQIEQGLTKPGVANAHALDRELDTGHAIFQAYYGPAGDDEISMLRDEVAQIGEKLTQMSRDLDELRAIVDQRRNSR